MSEESKIVNSAAVTPEESRAREGRGHYGRSGEAEVLERGGDAELPELG